MRLVNLKSSEARHVMLWLSPEGEITSLLLTEAEITSPSVKRLIASGRLSKTLLVKTAGMICRKKSIISESPLDYLLNRGWAHYYEQKGNWIWRAKEINRRQLAIARQIDDNDSLHSLLSGKFMESHFCGSCFKKINFLLTYIIFVYLLLFIFINLLGIYSQILSLNLWMMKTAVMIIANNGFQDHEFSATYEALQEANAQVTIVAGRKGQCVGVFGQKIDAAYELSEIKGDKFEMVIFIGGGGCLTQYLHDANYLRIAQEAKKLGAICIAPMVVSESGVFNGKIVTSRDDEGLQQKFIESYGGVWKDETVIRYGNIVTANGPEAAEAFGKECVKLLEDDTI